jgi:hypothetical protein
MPQDYFSLVTNQGLIKEAASNEPGGTAIDLTEMAVGDSNGTYYDPDGSETALANEVHRVTLTHVVVDENNTNQLIVEAVLDETIGPFYIREVGIFDSNGDLFAIGKYPETFKPNLPDGSGKRLYIRMILGFANSPNVNLVINNDIALDPNFGTDVNNALAERLIKTNNLSDLDDVATSRDNLEVYSKNYLNNKIGKNYIINGNFDIWQRGISFSNTGYVCDRFAIFIVSGEVTVSKEIVTPSHNIAGASKYMRISTNSSSSLALYQRIEDIKKLAGKTLTFSYYSNFMINGYFEYWDTINGFTNQTNFIVEKITDDDQFGWARYKTTFTLPDPPNVNLDNSFIGILLDDFPTSSNIDITGVQLEEGDVATNFDLRPVALELSLCQRYYEKSYNIDTPPGTIIGATMWLNGAYADPYLAMTSIQFKVEKRAIPTVTIYSPTGAINKVQSYSGELDVNNIVDIGTHGVGRVYTSNTSSPIINSWRSCHYVADAEL